MSNDNGDGLVKPDFQVVSRDVALALYKPIPRDRVGKDGKGNDAIPWPIIAAQMNNLFGPLNWHKEVRESCILQSSGPDARGNFSVTAKVVVRVTIHTRDRDGDAFRPVVKEGIGCDSNAQKDPAKAFEVAMMAAESIALKRALKDLGPAFGLDLYLPPSKGVAFPYKDKPLWANDYKAPETPQAKGRLSDDEEGIAVVEDAVVVSETKRADIPRKPQPKGGEQKKASLYIHRAYEGSVLSPDQAAVSFALLTAKNPDASDATLSSWIADHVSKFEQLHANGGPEAVSKKIAQMSESVKNANRKHEDAALSFADAEAALVALKRKSPDHHAISMITRNLDLLQPAFQKNERLHGVALHNAFVMLDQVWDVLNDIQITLNDLTTTI